MREVDARLLAAQRGPAARRHQRGGCPRTGPEHHGYEPEGPERVASGRRLDRLPGGHERPKPGDNCRAPGGAHPCGAPCGVLQRKGGAGLFRAFVELGETVPRTGLEQLREPVVRGDETTRCHCRSASAQAGGPGPGRADDGARRIEPAPCDRHPPRLARYPRYDDHFRHSRPGSGGGAGRAGGGDVRGPARRGGYSRRDLLRAAAASLRHGADRGHPERDGRPGLDQVDPRPSAQSPRTASWVPLRTPLPDGSRRLS